MHYHLSLTLLLTASLCAQEAVEPKSFFPENYESEYFIDLAAMRDNEFLDGVERNLLIRPLLKMVEREVLLELEDVDRIRAGQVRTGTPPRTWIVLVFEGTEALSLPDAAGMEHHEEVEIGKHRALRQKTNPRGSMAFDETVEEGEDRRLREIPNPEPETMLWVYPRAGTRVLGPAEILTPILEGEQDGGERHPDMRAFPPGTGKTLAHFTEVRAGKSRAEWGDGSPFPDEWWVDDDPIDRWSLRLAEQADGHVVFTGTLDFAEGGAGLDFVQGELEDGLNEVREDPRYAPLAKHLDGLTIERRDRELVVTLDLGPAREAGKSLGGNLTPYLELGAKD